MVVENFAGRHYPRASKCNPLPYLFAGIWYYGDEGWIDRSNPTYDHTTFGSIYGKEMKAGNISLRVHSNEAGWKKVDVALTFYWTK